MKDGRARLSVVIPAFDEAARIAATLARIAAWNESTGLLEEVLVVDDGSSDDTAAIAERSGSCRVLRNPHCGKALAVRTGMLAARAPHVLFSDADLAVPIAEVERFLEVQQRGYDVVIASRERQGARRIGEPSYRHAMGRVFNRVVRALVVPGIDDTQCGFKLFTREAAQTLFRAARLHGDPSRRVHGPAVTAFDVEILFLARRFGLRIAEVGVEWHYGDESKVRVFADSLRNLRDVLAVRWNALRGRY